MAWALLRRVNKRTEWDENICCFVILVISGHGSWVERDLWPQNEWLSSSVLLLDCISTFILTSAQPHTCYRASQEVEKGKSFSLTFIISNRVMRRCPSLFCPISHAARSSLDAAMSGARPNETWNSLSHSHVLPSTYFTLNKFIFSPLGSFSLSLSYVCAWIMQYPSIPRISIAALFSPLELSFAFFFVACSAFDRVSVSHCQCLRFFFHERKRFEFLRLSVVVPKRSKALRHKLSSLRLSFRRYMCTKNTKNVAAVDQREKSQCKWMKNQISYSNTTHFLI